MLAPVRAARGGRPRGKAPLGRVVVEPQLLQTVHQAVQPLALLVDDLPVVGQGVEQRLPLWHKQAPVAGKEKEFNVSGSSKKPPTGEETTPAIGVKRLNQGITSGRKAWGTPEHKKDEA